MFCGKKSFVFGNIATGSCDWQGGGCAPRLGVPQPSFGRRFPCADIRLWFLESEARVREQGLHEERHGADKVDQSGGYAKTVRELSCVFVYRFLLHKKTQLWRKRRVVLMNFPPRPDPDERHEYVPSICHTGVSTVCCTYVVLLST